MKKYIVYKITNLINEKIYIGCHQTDNLDDGYMGSGKLIKKAIQKYGLENFKKEILEMFDNPEGMFEMESKLVNEEFVYDKTNYNLKKGGNGGWDSVGSFDARSRGGKKGILKLHQKEKENEDFKVRMREVRKRNIKKAMDSDNYDPGKSFKGKHHSDETKKKIGEANSRHQSGKGNSQYGTCWIYNEDIKENKKIRKEYLEEWLEKGWKKGRKS